MAIKASANIIIIDDEELLRSSIRQILKNAGLKNLHHFNAIRTADTYITDCLQAEENIGLIICEYNMSELNGVDFFRQILKQTNKKKLPFLLISSTSQQSTILSAAKCGITNVLLKPFSKQDLINEMAKMFN